MQKLIKGLHRFQSEVVGPQREFFRGLAEGQKPDALFITCSDSRVNPNLITQTRPGELFIIRNAGNIVPPYGPHAGGEAATIEYAVSALKVRDIVVCGHSHCGAMNALVNPALLAGMPTVTRWLEHAEATRRIMAENYQHLDEDALISATIQENVLVQLENIKTHPAVAAALGRRELALHGWVYKIESGQVFAYDPEWYEFARVIGADETSVGAA